MSRPPTYWQNVGEVYLDQTLGWCLREYKVDTLLVVSTFSSGFDNRWAPTEGVEEKVQSLFGDHLIKSFMATAWPGTELSRHSSIVFAIRFDESVLNTIVNTENELFEWINRDENPLPEDICVFREGDLYPAFISVTHEKDAWVLSPGDPATLPPGFDVDPEFDMRKCLWKDEYFCRV